MKLYVFFGLPGAGKTYCSKVAEKYFGYQLYDGDNDLTEEMQKAIQTQEVITDDMRDIFFENLIESAKHLLKRYEKIIIHQTFIKEKYRKQFLRELPDTQFILIMAQENVREKRLRERTDYPLDQDYAKKMTAIFDEPKIAHLTLVNNRDGEKEVKEKLAKLLG